VPTRHNIQSEQKTLLKEPDKGKNHNPNPSTPFTNFASVSAATITSCKTCTTLDIAERKRQTQEKN
jgi:hypothetical protein